MTPAELAEGARLLAAADKGPPSSAHGAALNHWLRTNAAELIADAGRAQRLDAVILWALGEGMDFPDWPDTLTMRGNPKYWWRTELRKRYDAARASRTEGA